MGTININGKIYQGNNIQINGSSIVIDGVERRGDAQGVVEIRILEGTVQNISSDASISCGDVQGNVHAGGSVSCDNVYGNVNAGGSVSCDEIGGSVNAGGSISRS